MNFVFLSTMSWQDADGAYAPTRLSLELAQRGHRVSFVQSLKPRDPPNTRALPITVRGLDELGLSALVAGLAWRGVYLDSLDDIMSQLAAALAPLESADPHAPRIAVLNAPFDPLARLLPFLQERGYWIVYYPQDDYPAMFELGYLHYNRGQHAHLAQRADLLVCLAPPIAEKLRKYGRPVAVVPDAVDAEEFRANRDLPPPTQVLRGTECTLGFWGSLSDPMFDADLVGAVARAQPRWAFNLIGSHDVIPHLKPVYERLAALPNVRLHGAIPHGQLIQYHASFDVCILPAPDNDFSRGRDPLKVYEYLAAYKPIVVTNVPHLRETPYVHHASTAQEFIEAVRNAQAERVERRIVDAFLAQHTWSARAEGFVTQVQEMLTQTRGRYGTLDAQLLEAAGQSQPVSPLSQYELHEIMRLLREGAKATQELTRVQAWARQLEAQSRVQQQSLPRRIARRFQNGTK